MIYFASIVGLLKTLLVILLVYIGFKSLARLFAPLLLRFVAKKAQQRFGGNFQSQNYTSQNYTKTGETTIDKVPNQQKQSTNKVGEYIDFEEID